jgi:hypothetical protein
MALIVFGGAVAYLIDTRPSAYRAEGGDVWLFAEIDAAPGQRAAVLSALQQGVAHFDAPGLWGAEVLEEGEHLTLLTRWGSLPEAERFQAQKLGSLAPDAALLASPPQMRLRTVRARR